MLLVFSVDFSVLCTSVVGKIRVKKFLFLALVIVYNLNGCKGSRGRRELGDATSVQIALQTHFPHFLNIYVHFQPKKANVVRIKTAYIFPVLIVLVSMFKHCEILRLEYEFKTQVKINLLTQESPEGKNRIFFSPTLKC